MPIYEFYCSNCNMIFNFLSKAVNSGKRPACPRCKHRKLEKLISSFAFTGKAVESPRGNDLPIDETKMERAISSLAGEAEGINQDDPRQAAKLMRKFSDMTGLEMGKGMKEAINRLEAGEDPGKIEADMDDLLNGQEDVFLMPDKKDGKNRKVKQKLPPVRDKTLYEL
ncbi:MAG: hypothetical protein A2283_02960 [Lentisphaerae bacterium RIFOXYA12_FULL_48_11]|nr:MAG: hypothetical protein A2283_02960 [Lentisphaerae bacterium RIFOXYA12_FULL_48_11]